MQHCVAPAGTYQLVMRAVLDDPAPLDGQDAVGVAHGRQSVGNDKHGATVRDLLRLVISRGLRLTVAGIVIGAAAALLLTRLMGNLLYKVSPRDPIAFGAALIILIAVALVAFFLPARRAARIDPVRALRM